MSRRCGRDGSGAATVAVVGTIGLLVLVAVVGTGCVGLVLAHRRAQAAADLAALAGARALGRGEEPCAAAAPIARDNGAVLVGCTPGADADVTVAVEVRPAGYLRGAILGARARAGPGTAGSELSPRSPAPG